MSYLFTRLNFEIPFDGATYIDESKVKRLIQGEVTPEPGFVNWLFGLNSSSLTSLSGGHVMTPNAGAVPSYSDTSVMLPASAGFNGLQSEYKDSAEQTICAVIKYSGQPSQILLGAISSTVGECISMTGGGAPTHLIRNSAGALFSTAVPTPASLKAGDYIFLAISRSGDNVIAMIGGAAGQVNLTNSLKAPATALNVGPGNTAYNTAGFSKDIEIVEFLYKASATSLADLQSVYNSSKLRCSVRGKHVL